MSKSHNTSYQGFRRKNSLNSLEANKGSAGTDLTFLKFRHNEHISEVENLSMQLQSFSKRSLSSRSFCEENPKHSHSSTNIRQLQEGVTQNLYFHSSRKQEIMPQKKVEYFQGKDERNSPRERKQKVSNSMIFNKFDIIEEDQYQNQEEQINQIVPVTFKVNPQAKPQDKKITAKLGNIKQVAPQPPVKKTVNSIKIESVVGIKKEKMKMDLNDIDKMQKEFDAKRTTRDSNPTRTQSSANIVLKKPATNNLKDSGKLVKSVAPQHQLKSVNDKNKQVKSSANILLSAKMAQSKQQITFEQEKKEQFIPTRMLNEKEKYSLLHKMEALRQIIQKNDICAENLEEIVGHMSKIEKLLTK